MHMITFDLMLNEQDQIRVDIKQNMFEFRTSLKKESMLRLWITRVPGYLARLKHRSRWDNKAMK